MIYYTIQQSDIWSNLPNGKRNVRILPIAMCLYLIIQVIAFEFKDKNKFCEIVRRWLPALIFIDIFCSACLYREHYGRSVLKEFDDLNDDIYNEKTHKYTPLSKVLKTAEIVEPETTEVVESEVVENVLENEIQNEIQNENEL